MKTAFIGRVAPLAAFVAAIVVAAGLGGCSPVADVSAVMAERARPVQRYDVTQALAANGRVVVAGTQSGAVLVSADHGRSWQRRPLGAASLIGLATCPDGGFVGIDFYRKVWSADPLAENWRPVALDKPRTPLTVTCDGQGRWWVAGTRATLAVSADHGASWTVTDLGEDAQFTAIQFIDAEYAIAVGEFGMVAVSEDGGASWALRAPIPDEFYPYAMLFADRQRGWVSGLAGQILHTTDGGATWSRQANATQLPLYRLFMHQGVPHGVGAGGALARLDGDGWRAVPYSDPQPVFLAAGASLPGQQALVAGGPGGLLRVIGTDAN